MCVCVCACVCVCVRACVRACVCIKSAESVSDYSDLIEFIGITVTAICYQSIRSNMSFLIKQLTNELSVITCLFDSPLLIGCHSKNLERFTLMSNTPVLQ